MTHRKYFFVVGAVCAAVLTSAQTYTPSAPMSIHVCALGTNADTYREARFMALNWSSYRSAEWPLLAFSDYELLSNATDSQPPDAVRSYFAYDGPDCDIAIGPATSTLAEAFSPILSRPLWLDYASTSVDLSDKFLYPAFARVVPSDATGGAALIDLAMYFGFTTINILNTAETYGRSVATYVAMNFLGASPSNNVGMTLELPLTPPQQSVEAKLRQLQSASSRVVVVAMSVSGTVFATFFQVAAALQLTLPPSERFIFLFSESACSSTTAWVTLPGAFCTTFAINQTTFAPFWTAFAARDRTPDSDILVAHNFPPSKVGVDTPIRYAPLAADAVRFALSGFNNFVQQYQRRPSSSVEIFSFLVNGTTTNAIDGSGGHVIRDGMTGVVRLTSDGDRASIFTAVVTVLQGGSTAVVGNISDNKVIIDMHLLYNGVSLSPFLRGAAVSNDSTDKIIVAVVVSVGGSMLVCFVVVFVCVLRRDRRTAFAPQDERLPYTIVFTDIQSSTMLWAREPQMMGAAIDAHHSTIRALISAHEGYEVKTAGDSFMVAFVNAADAIEFALALQEALLNVDWKSLSGAHWTGKDAFQRAYEEVDLEKNAAVKDAGEWRGLRVRVGVHSAFGLIRNDEVANIFDYYGTVVNCAARVEAAGNGGQVIVTESALRLALRDAGAISAVDSGFCASRIQVERLMGDAGSPALDCTESVFSQAYKMSLKNAEGADVERSFTAPQKHRATPRGERGKLRLCNEPIAVESYIFPCNCLPTSLGRVALRGLEEPVGLVQLLPASLASRRFPTLRTEATAQANDEHTEANGDSFVRILTAEDAPLAVDSPPDALGQSVASIREQGLFDAVVANATVLNALSCSILAGAMSPLSPQQQERIVKDMCAAWRITNSVPVHPLRPPTAMTVRSIATRASRLTRNGDADRMAPNERIGAIAARAAAVVAQQRRKRQASDGTHVPLSGV